jgi:hypothetical protein
MDEGAERFPGLDSGMASDFGEALETYESMPEAADATAAKTRTRKGRGRAAESSSTAEDGGRSAAYGDWLLARLLRLELTPKRIVADEDEAPWDEDSLLYQFDSTSDSEDQLSLSEFIETIPEVSKLKFQFQRDLATNRSSLTYNTKVVLDEDYPAIIDYLVAHAYYVGKRTEIDGLTNYILSGSMGAANVANYAVVSAARTIIDRDQLKVPDFNVDDSPFTRRLRSKGLSLSSISFEPSLKSVVKDFVFNRDEVALIEGADIGELPEGIMPQLVRYIQNSPVPIDADNVKFFLPLFISQIQGVTSVSDTTEVDAEESAKDFDVRFLEDDLTMVQISQSAVKCAAQLYYSMVLGEELDVFGIVNYFTYKYLVRGAIEISDSRLREDLQNYVFSNRFTDLKTKKVVDRTRPSERQMFYRQVFNEGRAQITDDVIVNKEFTKLWKVLMLESAKYLQEAQESFYPDSYVSKQNVMQAVEDLQYNLSTHCTGMANVITPLIYSELDFVIRRIFMHPEIMDQIVPSGGTWWRVVETLYMAMKNVRPKSTVLYNKAKLGFEIIRSIAEYNPATFEDNKTFSAFISQVDAFITTQSIIQEALTDYLKRDDQGAEQDGMSQNGWHGAEPEAEAVPAMPAATTGSDEWDF